MRDTSGDRRVRGERRWLSETTRHSLAHIALPDGLYLIPGAGEGTWTAIKQLRAYLRSLFLTR